MTQETPITALFYPSKKRPYTRKLKVFVVMGSDGNERLVRAYTAADALRHVTPTFHVAQAEHVHPITLMASGGAEETAGSKAQELPADEAAGLSD